MIEEVVFTIVAKNYLPLARAMAWSIKNQNSRLVKIIIFLADEPDASVNMNDPDELIIPVSSIGSGNITDMAFKYNVTEFCTAVKPMCFQYVFKELGATKAIYFDPDIFVFNDLDTIFDVLDTKEIMVTPHYITPQINYTGDQKESSTLFVGIFNFGFVAFKNTEHNLMLLDWWNNRLSDQCYADWQDALHTDQKWADFLPVYATDTLHISKHIGCNLAPWNLYEREIFKSDGKLKVKNRINGNVELLIFVHFAGYDPNNTDLIHKDFWNMPISKYPDYSLVRDLYIITTNKFKFNELRQSGYTYSDFSNGTPVLDQHRRLYRSLTENGETISDPFSATGEFYKKLSESGMISAKKPQKQNKKNYADFDSKLNKINKVLKMIYRVLGNDRYFLLMRLLNRYTRPENQVFLLNKKSKKIY